jgi:hypothetical protein
MRSSKQRVMKKNVNWMSFWKWKVGVARFFLAHDTKTGKNVPNEHKMHQMVEEYYKCP